MTVKLKPTQYEIQSYNGDEEFDVRMVIDSDGEFNCWHSGVSFSSHGNATPQDAVEDLIKQMRAFLNALESGVELE